MRYEFDIYRKPALTNELIKPHYCIPPDTIASIFKGFLARATRISCQKCFRTEIEYLTDIFCENGPERKTLQNKTNNFQKKARNINNNNDINNTNKKQTINLSLDTKNWTKNQKMLIESSISNGP